MLFVVEGHLLDANELKTLIIALVGLVCVKAKEINDDTSEEGPLVRHLSAMASFKSSDLCLMLGNEQSDFAIVVALEGSLDDAGVGGSLSVSNGLRVGAVLGSEGLLGLNFSDDPGDPGVFGHNHLGAHNVDVDWGRLGLVGDDVRLNDLLVEGNVLPLFETIISSVNPFLLDGNQRRVCHVDSTVSSESCGFVGNDADFHRRLLSYVNLGSETEEL